MSKQFWDRRTELKVSCSLTQTILQSYCNQNCDTGTKTQINGTKQSSEINPCAYDQVIYNSGDRIPRGEKITSSVSAAGETGQPHAEKNRIFPHRIYKNKHKTD